MSNALLSSLLDRIGPRVLLDGGAGTSLIAQGLQVTKESTASWNLSHPDLVQRMHREFVLSGVDAIQTNTFSGNRLALQYFAEDDVQGCNEEGVRLAKAAAKDTTLIIGSMGPTGMTIAQQENVTSTDLEQVFYEQALFLSQGGVDFLHLETMAHPKEARAALRGVRKACNLPVVISFAATLSAENNYVTTMGFPLDTCIAMTQEEKADALGVNCMLSPNDMLPLIQQMLSKWHGIVFAKPTFSPNGVTSKTTTIEFREGLNQLFQAGARAVGGCCGTSAKHLKKLTKTNDS